MDYLLPRSYSSQKNLKKILYNYFSVKHICLSSPILSYYKSHKHKVYDKVGN